MPSGEGVKHCRGDDDQAVNLISLSSAEIRPRVFVSSYIHRRLEEKLKIHILYGLFHFSGLSLIRPNRGQSLPSLCPQMTAYLTSLYNLTRSKSRQIGENKTSCNEDVKSWQTSESQPNHLGLSTLGLAANERNH